MKRSLYSPWKKWTVGMTLLCAFAPSFTSCSQTEDGSYVDPITMYEKIGGRWVLNSITQTDETNGKELSLTDQFNFETFAINLLYDAGGSPKSFSIDGNAPALLPVSGTWAMEHSFVNSDGSAAKILLNDNTQLTVTAVPGAQKVLEFKRTRTSKGQPFVSYKYNLVPVTE